MPLLKLIFSILFTCLVCTHLKSQSVVVQKGDSVTIIVKANKRFTHTHIKVNKGDTYQITATGLWQDAGFPPTGAGGFPPLNGAMRFARFLKPVPKENYLKLVAKVKGKHWPVGTSAHIHFDKSGSLSLQPNDAIFFFGNNSGEQNVTVRRLE